MDIRTVLAGLVGSAAQGVRTRSPVADHYTRYLGALLERALTSWSQVHASGVTCSVELRGQNGERARCGGPAIGACMVCGGAVCVGHSLVSPHHIMCLGCALSAVEQLSGAVRVVDGEKFVGRPPPWDPGSSPFGGGERESDPDLGKEREYLARLGLFEGASESEIREAYRRLAAEHHPDKARTKRLREERENKLKQLNEAYSFLTGRRAA